MKNMQELQYWKSLINIGLSKFYILKILYEKPSHGYGILKTLSSLTEGCCLPTLGTIYPILQKLTAEGYAKVQLTTDTNSGRERKIYILTPTGKKTYKIALEAWRSVIPYIHEAIDSDYKTAPKKSRKSTKSCNTAPCKASPKKSRKPAKS